MIGDVYLHCYKTFMLTASDIDGKVACDNKLPVPVKIIVSISLSNSSPQMSLGIRHQELGGLHNI